jgi:hypothetical protein
MPGDETPAIGSGNTYVGQGPVPSMGDGNTIYTAADTNGNVLLHEGGTAIGAGARADSTSVAIGAGALGGDQPQLLGLLAELRQILDKNGAVEAGRALAELRHELQSPSPDYGKLRKLWTVIKTAAATNEAIALITRIAPLLIR